MNNLFSNVLTEQLIAPYQIGLDITNKCNLRCLHCYNSSGENGLINNELSDIEVLNFISNVSELNLYNFCFCGGEPLLRKDLIIECSKILKQKNTIVSIVTNGLLANHDTIDQLVEAGIVNIQYSLDGEKASHEKLRNKLNIYDKVIDAIIYTAQKNVKLSIAFCPTSFNINEFKSVHKFLIKLTEQSRKNNPIKLRIQPLMELGRASKNLNEIVPSEEQYRSLLRYVYKHKDDLVNIEWGDPIDHLIRFAALKLPLNFVSIRANGDISVSPYLPLVVGNIKKHTLQEYWDAGLNKVWETNIVKYLSSYLRSIPDMYQISKVFPQAFEKDIMIDLCEQDLNNMDLICNSL